MTHKKKPSRRRVLKGMAAGVLVASSQTIKGATTTTAATTRSAGVSLDEIAAWEKLMGREFNERERRQMAGSMESNRARLKSLRERKIDPGVEPAIQFNPRIQPSPPPSPGVPGEGVRQSSAGIPGEGKIHLSDGEVPTYDGNPESLAFATVTDLARLIQARKITSTELTQLCHQSDRRTRARASEARRRRN
jgi:hypothetical protein